MVKKGQRRLVVAMVGFAMIFSQSAYAEGGESEDRSCFGVGPLVVCWPP